MRIERPARTAGRARADSCEEGPIRTRGGERPGGLFGSRIRRAVVVGSRIIRARNAHAGSTCRVCWITPPRAEASHQLRLIDIDKARQPDRMIANVGDVQAQIVREGPLDSQALISIFRSILRESRKIQENSPRRIRTNFVQQENIHGDQYGSKRIRS